MAHGRYCRRSESCRAALARRGRTTRLRSSRMTMVASSISVPLSLYNNLKMISMFSGEKVASWVPWTTFVEFSPTIQGLA